VLSRLALVLPIIGGLVQQPAAPRTDPIIVKIVEPESDLAGLGEVLLGALGITGVIVMAALVFGVVVAGAMFWIRSRQSAGES
jgi:hypothetical protein